MASGVPCFSDFHALLPENQETADNFWETYG
jgi:hypothetical protein